MCLQRSMLTMAVWVCFLICSLIQSQTLAAPLQEPETLLDQAEESYASGNFEMALRYWTEARAFYQSQGNTLEGSKILANAAAAYQALGKNERTVDHLEQANELAEQAGDRRWHAAVRSQLGGAYLLIHEYEKADTVLNQALQTARKEGAVDIQALAYNNLGDLHRIQHRDSDALTAYEASIRFADQVENSLLATQAAANAGQLALNTTQTEIADNYLTQANSYCQKLPDSHDKAFLLIRVAQLQRQLGVQLPHQSANLTIAAYSNLQDASEVAARIDDYLAESFAYGYLGELYEEQKRYEEALDQNQRAIYALQKIHAPEVQYRWEWQKGRLFRAQGHSQDAIEAYRNATQTLYTVRVELAASLEASRQTYHQVVGPLFLEYADLLLQEGESAHDPEQLQRTLLEARDAVELLKAVELQDYFQDDCVAVARTRARELDETLSSRTAAIYPILFPDRTDLLLSTSDGLARYTVPVPGNEMTAEIREFRRTLEKRTTRQYQRPAQRLYDWLIRPLEEELGKREIDTLVIIPDAALRTIPMAALHDGKEFLIQKYALVSTPSLELTDPRPINRENVHVLLNGLTVPVQGFPGLSFVPAELREIQAVFGGKILENEDFRKPQVTEELTSRKYSIVHIASHGKFVGSVKDSFILTYDSKLSMDDLEKIISPSLYEQENPIELLTLSACQTAVGDDRAALGLAGVAIKAGARSALATLWAINDQATSSLVAEFYRQLGKPGMSKAKALQQAQLGTLNQLRYRHPAYWSPFLLIGNWL